MIIIVVWLPRGDYKPRSGYFVVITTTQCKLVNTRSRPRGFICIERVNHALYTRNR